MSEILYTCPFCDRRGFTARGMKAHYCQQLGGRRLRGTEWERVRPAVPSSNSPLSSLNSQLPPMPKGKRSSSKPGALVVVNDASLVITEQPEIRKLQAHTIDALETIARTEHDNVLRRVLVGLALHRIKASVKHGEFMPWLKKHVKGAGYTQCTYMMRAALAFLDNSKVDKPDLLALPGDQLGLQLTGKDAPQFKLVESARTFVGEQTWGELLEKHDIRETKKIGGARDKKADGKPAQVDPEQLYLQSRDEIGSALHLAETLLIKENRLQHLVGHEEEIAGVVAGLRDLADKVEAAAKPLLKKS